MTDMALRDIRQTTTEFQKAGMKWEDAFGQAYHSIQKISWKKKMAEGFGQELQDYIKNVYSMEKEIAKIEAKFRPFLQKPANELDEVVITAKDLSKKDKSGTGTVDEEKAKALLKRSLKKKPSSTPNTSRNSKKPISNARTKPCKPNSSSISGWKPSN